MVERFISSFVASDANAAIAGILLLRVENWFSLVPDLLDRLRLKYYGSSEIETLVRWRRRQE
jgi:hypothetical protein